MEELRQRLRLFGAGGGRSHLRFGSVGATSSALGAGEGTARSYVPCPGELTLRQAPDSEVNRGQAASVTPDGTGRIESAAARTQTTMHSGEAACSSARQKQSKNGYIGLEKALVYQDNNENVDNIRRFQAANAGERGKSRTQTLAEAQTLTSK